MVRYMIRKRVDNISRYIGRLNLDACNGKVKVGFIFVEDSYKVNFPINTSLHELISDGWEFAD